MRTYRLTNEPEGLGLSCTAAGLSLAGTPLLRRSDGGFVPRSAMEIGSLLKAAYGADGDANLLESSLQAIARALNGGDLARAAITAVLTRTPELSVEAARRLAAANDNLTKYDPDQPRDWHGRWATDGAAGPKAPRSVDPAATPVDATANRSAAPTANPAATTANGGTQSEGRGAAALEQALESRYDDLGPIDFAKQVLQFGDQLARNGASLQPAEKDQALAEYTFLEGRLSFWLAYE